MPEYVYKAVTAKGQIVRNRVEDVNRQTLIKKLKNENKKDDPGQRQEWENCIKAFHVEPTLKKLMFDGGSSDSEGTAAFDKEYREDSK